MGRLIDADELLDWIQNCWDWATVDGITSTTVLKQTMTDISQLPTVEAIPKAEYEARLKDDTLAVLEKIADEINKRIQAIPCSSDSSDIGVKVGYMYSLSLINANINALKENGEE